MRLPQVIKMIACRFMDADGNGSREQAIKCIDWCLSRDVHLLSNSWGEVPNSPSLQVLSTSAACVDHSYHGLDPGQCYWIQSLM